MTYILQKGSNVIILEETFFPAIPLRVATEVRKFHDLDGLLL